MIESILTGGGFVALLAVFFLSVLLLFFTIALPFYIYGIHNQSKRTNALLNELLNFLTNQANTDGEQLSQQTRALSKIASDGEQVLQHAIYQTEVTKHRIASKEAV